MNQEEINLLNESFNVSSEDLKALLDFVQIIIREYEKQQRLMEGLTPESPNFSATVATLIPFMTATTTLGVLDAYTDIESDATLLQQEFARLRSLIRNHQQQIQRLTSTRTAAARKILPSSTASPASTSGESRLVIDSAIPTPTNQSVNVPIVHSELELGANVKISQNIDMVSNNTTSPTHSHAPQINPEELLNSPNTAATLAAKAKLEQSDPAAELARLEAAKRTFDDLAANANDLEFMKKSQDLGAFLTEETVKARKRLTEHERRQLLKDANSSVLANIDGLDPQSKRRSWHAAIAGQGEPSANVSLVDQSAFNFPGQSTASEEAKQKSMVDFCSDPLEHTSSSALNSPCLPPRGLARSSMSLEQHQQLLRHPTVGLKKVNLLDLQSIPAAYIKPSEVAELAANAGSRAEVSALIDQRLVAEHLRRQDPNSVALAENHPANSAQIFQQSFCREALNASAGNFTKSFNYVQQYPNPLLTPLWEDPILPKSKNVNPPIIFEPSDRPTTPHGSVIYTSFPPKPYLKPDLPQCPSCIPNYTTKPPPGFAPLNNTCLLYTSPSPRDRTRSRMPSSA